MKYYLQRICVLIKHRECEKNVLEMKALVEQQGLLVDIRYLGYTYENVQNDDKKVIFLSEYKREKQEKEQSIFVSDDSDTLRKYDEMGYAVLAYFHDYNKEENFSGIAYGCERIEQLDAAYFDRVYRRCKRLPWDILETPRCIIRETTVDDVDAFYDIYREPSITEYMEDLFTERQQEITYIQDYIKNVYEFYDFGVWSVVLKETGEVIGRAGLSYREGCDIPELGFVIGVPWQRKGIAFEVCDAILHYGMDMFEFETFQALVEEGNDTSVRLCQRLGFNVADDVWIEGKMMHRLLKSLNVKEID